MKRRISRIKAMMILYHDDLMKEDYEKVEAEGLENLLKEESDKYSYDEDFCNELVNGVRSNLSTIDRLIAISLTNYTIDRLSYIDRALLRIGVYELKFTNTPKNIVINEIVSLSHEYSEVKGFESSKFNNALLDKISQRISDGK